MNENYVIFGYSDLIGYDLLILEKKNFVEYVGFGDFCEKSINLIYVSYEFEF